ncbi:uncharacterized protein LOC107646801 [Arachis ipaensis]|uniref:uncharacterized protein LOC107646801 n=1 Tax=Arachis ipaensis TaxID=130454 RepID=UPI0007AF1DA1|nr:uncharacterized protein LOC107646801 [Arachis ipaensis]XP_025661406.1 uncharacterized protein LOC112757023 [Arachis hypogaea]
MKSDLGGVGTLKIKEEWKWKCSGLSGESAKGFRDYWFLEGVNDVIVVGACELFYSISDLKAPLHYTFEMKDLDSLSYFIGLEVIYSDDGIYLFQTKYAYDLLARAGITDSCTESTPLELDVRFTPLDGTILDNPILYRQLVRGFVYLIVTRPDIAYLVHVLSQFFSTPHTTHYATAGNPTDRRSTTGYYLFLGDSLIS